MTNEKKIHIVWLDDDFEYRSERLQPYVKVLNRVFPNVKVTQVYSVNNFAQILKDYADNQSGQTNRIDGLILDVKLSVPVNPSYFTDFGFSDVRWYPNDAGSQILGLIKNDEYAKERPEWLKKFTNTPALLLTTSDDIKDTWHEYVEYKWRNNPKQAQARVKTVAADGLMIWVKELFIDPQTEAK